MSHHSGLSMVALDASDIAAYFGKDLAVKLIGEAGDCLSETTPATPIRRMYGYTRSDWFKWNMRNLLAKANLPALQFISEQACSHLVLRSASGMVEEAFLEGLAEEEARNDFATHYYTVIPPTAVPRVQDDLNRLFSWLGDNVSQVVDTVEWGEEEVMGAMDNAITCVTVAPAPNKSINAIACHGDEGDDPRFLFCALKSIQDLLAHAALHGLYVIYENDNYTGLDWLKSNRPRILNY